MIYYLTKLKVQRKRDKCFKKPVGKWLINRDSTRRMLHIKIAIRALQTHRGVYQRHTRRDRIFSSMHHHSNHKSNPHLQHTQHKHVSLVTKQTTAHNYTVTIALPKRRWKHELEQLWRRWRQSCLLERQPTVLQEPQSVRENN